ncbi:MAG: GNAT family N-acetyltransferase [Halobacteriaceae archaeon]
MTGRLAPAGAVRTAGDDDVVPAMRVLDGSLLDVDAATVRRRLEDGTALVAADGLVRGVLVGARRDDGVHVEALAVRRPDRRRGYGSALLDVAAGRWDRVTARFRPEVRGFYEAAGFRVEAVGDGRERLRGVRAASD